MDFTDRQNKGMMYLLTDQPVAKSLLRFSIPITVGGILSQLYSFMDAVIVGRFVGANALAAVGAGLPVSQLLVAMMTPMTVLSFNCMFASSLGCVCSRCGSMRTVRSARS